MRPIFENPFYFWKVWCYLSFRLAEASIITTFLIVITIEYETSSITKIVYLKFFKHLFDFLLWNCSFLLLHHQADEFREVDTAAAVLVGVVDHVLDFILGRILTWTHWMILKQVTYPNLNQFEVYFKAAGIFVTTNLIQLLKLWW